MLSAWSSDDSHKEAETGTEQSRMLRQRLGRQGVERSDEDEDENDDEDVDWKRLYF